MALSKWVDTFDVFGTRSGKKKARQAEEAAARAREEALGVQRERFAEQQRLQQPMIDIGQNALQGFGDYRQTPEFDQRLAQGTRTMNRGSAAGGMFNSSNANEGMAGFVNNLTGDELNRQYQQKLNAVKIGHGATNAIGNAASAMGNNMASIYGTGGNVASQNALNSGQQSADLWGTAGNALSGIGAYMGQGGFGGGGGGTSGTGIAGTSIASPSSGMAQAPWSLPNLNPYG